MSRDTMDACAVCVGDLDINDGDDIKLTITLMSNRSMQQFLREVSSMKAATASARVPKCRKTLIFRQPNENKTPVSGKNVEKQKSNPKRVPDSAPNRARKPVSSTKQVVAPAARLACKAKTNHNAKEKNTRQPLQSRMKTKHRVASTTKPAPKVQRKGQKPIDDKESKTMASMEEKKETKANTRSRRPVLNKKRVLSSKAKAAQNIEKKRTKVVDCPESKPVAPREKKDNSSLQSFLDDSSSDSSEGSAVISDDFSDSDDDFGNLSDSSDGPDFSPASQASSKKAKKISFTQKNTPNSEKSTSGNSNSADTLSGSFTDQAMKAGAHYFFHLFALL